MCQLNEGAQQNYFSYDKIKTKTKIINISFSNTKTRIIGTWKNNRIK